VKTDTGPDLQAMRNALAPQDTMVDQGTLRFYVARREARVDVRFAVLSPDGSLDHPERESLWLLTAALCDEGLRMVEQEHGSGEDGTQFFPLLARHLAAARPLLPLPDPMDVRYLTFGRYDFRVRRFSDGFRAPVRVDRRLTWSDAAPASWLHVFDGEFHPGGLGYSPALRTVATTETFIRGWGQIEHLVHFAAYASLTSDAPFGEVVAKLTRLLAWGGEAPAQRHEMEMAAPDLEALAAMFFDGGGR